MKQQARPAAYLTITAFTRLGSISILSILLLLVIIIATGTGAMHISPAQVVAILLERAGIRLPVAYPEHMVAVLWMIRLPRVILAVLIGAGLGISGAALQGLFRNPLADPALIGVSAGASLTAVVLIVLQPWLHFAGGNMWQSYLQNIITFAGAMITVWTVFRMSVYGNRAVISIMLLCGIAINALCGAFTGLMTFIADNEQLRNITFWTLGSLGGASWQTVLAVLPFVGLPVLLLPGMAPALNVFALGEQEAMHSGVKVNKLKTQLIIYATMAVAAGVAVAGIISFIGLVVPHITRQFTGPDHRVLIPCSALAGALLLTVADLICRTIIAPAELPVGIITAITGTPFFIWLILKDKRVIAV
ncbi:iron ABC transporter permease [Chitinophaga agrisoli]|uniref:Iron ABC transporter permease n=1 Tax=Chitinophaga agrisoli TaxID=2607653 RepID=A0A5B2VNW8_9BACT|nr:iron ABC transporter permease [Chitinophaga agrisoli]KAA2240811.1 iron ABC transporter permease [Chitinophaga agrisoli]